jgi:hypothetical protein
VPPPTNIIFNGTFDLQGSGWSGTDIEAQNREGQYFGNGSTNRVAELDGAAIQTTVMQQTIAIAAPLTTELTFRAALRPSGTLGIDGFRVDIVNNLGVVIATVTIASPSPFPQRAVTRSASPKLGTTTLWVLSSTMSRCWSALPERP